jgi:hypothetical protein
MPGFPSFASGCVYVCLTCMAELNGPFGALTFAGVGGKSPGLGLCRCVALKLCRCVARTSAFLCCAHTRLSTVTLVRPVQGVPQLRVSFVFAGGGRAGRQPRGRRPPDTPP